MRRRTVRTQVFTDVQSSVDGDPNVSFRHRAQKCVHPLYGKNWFTCSQDLTV